jgi:hypothetical protein
MCLGSEDESIIKSVSLVAVAGREGIGAAPHHRLRVAYPIDMMVERVLRSAIHHEDVLLSATFFPTLT